MSLLWNPEEAATIVEMPLEVITTGTQNMGNGVYWLRAGTPLDEYFAVSNDEDAVYLVAEDFFFITTNPAQPKIVPLITAGYVDLSKAEKASGLTYTDDCIAALAAAGITLVDGALPSGGGGDEPFVVTYSSGSADKTLTEIGDALLAGKRVYGVSGGVVYPATGWTFSGDSLVAVQFTEQQYVDMMGTTMLAVTGFGNDGTLGWGDVNVSVALGS